MNHVIIPSDLQRAAMQAIQQTLTAIQIHDNSFLPSIEGHHEIITDIGVADVLVVFK